MMMRMNRVMLKCFSFWLELTSFITIGNLYFASAGISQRTRAQNREWLKLNSLRLNRSFNRENNELNELLLREHDSIILHGA